MMESLGETAWDVVISGTGLRQSLLALALSRSDKNILHLDENDYYGGAEAAFSLQEIEEWVKKSSLISNPPFFNASIRKPEVEGRDDQKLSFSRAYTLSLSPQIIYTRSKLLTQLVSSKVYRQLEFQAVGNWWMYDVSDAAERNLVSSFKRIPNGREDIFADRSIDVRAKRALMKFLRFVVEYEEHRDVWTSYAENGLPTFLSTQFQLPVALQTVILALTLSLESPEKVTVAYALPRIARHLTSFGVFGPGFGAVIPKWGGGSEIAQVGCRAGAVGGGVYVLGTGVASQERKDGHIQLNLSNDEVIRTDNYVHSKYNSSDFETPETTFVAKMIAIVSSGLSSFFVSTVEGALTPAVSLVVFPSASLEVAGSSSEYPICVMIHSSDTGECPSDQCVLYASTMRNDKAKDRLEAAVAALIKSPDASISTDDGAHESPKLLYSVYYEQGCCSTSVSISDGIRSFPSSSLDLAFDDTMLDQVESVWNTIVGTGKESSDSINTYMVFEEREGTQVDEDDAGDI